MMTSTRSWRMRKIAISAAVLMLASACGGGGDGEADDAAATGGEETTAEGEETTGEGEETTGEGGQTTGDASNERELTLAHSYDTNHAHHRCGSEGLKEKVEAADVGLTIEIFPNSQLGADADRFTSVASGDIDIDLQGASAIASTYGPVGVTDAAYAFEDADHVFEYLETDAFADLRQTVLEETGVHLTDAWWFGMRNFTANQAIRHPDDFQGLRMRFPDTPRYLANADALGAEAVAVAFEEVYLSLQQGIIDGQENPIPTIASLNLPEVQSHVSLTEHQAGFQFVIVSDATWSELSSEQQEALTTAIRETRAEDRECIEADEQKFLDEWEETGDMTVVEDVDKDAFIERAESYLSENLTGEELEIYESIRELR